MKHTTGTNQEVLEYYQRNWKEIVTCYEVGEDDLPRGCHHASPPATAITTTAAAAAAHFQVFDFAGVSSISAPAASGSSRTR